MEKVQHFKIPLEEIKLATNNFSDENFIARGGFGKVYVGKLTKSGQQNAVAVKRLDRKLGQGDHEFLMEIQMLSCYSHKNLISLLGFCEESGEKILVYEHAKHGSLDRYLSDSKLSWMQRLKISLGAARGFNYLHNDVGPQHRVLHRDIKSSNILLNENWEAKISDFGLSIIGPSNVEFTFLVTNACGTYGYIDPQYVKTGILTKESDVYSFGVVLFEILCGRLALINTYQDERRFLASLARLSYEQNRLYEIILPSIKSEMKIDSLNVFSFVAYECLKENRSERPTMAWIVEKLEEALERQEHNVDALIECVTKNIGFSEGKPVAAFTIYKCLLHWNSFDAEKTSVFERLIRLIGSAIEDHDNNEHMAYWLSNASTLLFLIQRSIKSDVQNDQVNAKYPVLLFKQQLIAYVERMYGIMCDNLKKELSSFLALCIQAPRASMGVLRSNHWQGIIDCLNIFLGTLKEYFMPPVMVQKIFTQIFSYINARLFNSVLLHGECCTFSNGEYVKTGLAELELWCSEAQEEYVGSAWDELKHIRQAVGFLIIRKKYRLSHDEIINDLCPILSAQQLYRMCTNIWDEYSTRNLSPNVISSIRILMTEDSNNATHSSVLLNDNSSVPFSVDIDLCSTLEVEEFTDMEPVVELAENPAFHFLYKFENVDALIECVTKDIGFSQGKPVAAFTIYKCLLHWKSFDAEKTSVFERLIQMIGSAIEDHDNNEHMAYWLSNASALLFLLQRSIQPPPSTSLFVRMTMALRSSQSTMNPTLLFKQQLTTCVKKMYGIIYDNLRKELGSFLPLCIQVPPASKGVLQSNHWQGIIDCLNSILNTFKENFVPRIIVQKIFTRIFSYINVQLFNSLLLHGEYCTFSNGEYVKTGLAEIELWCFEAHKEYFGSAWDELKHIRQVVGLLIIYKKYRLSLDEIINELCPILSIKQLDRICTLICDDVSYNIPCVSQKVISSIKILTNDSNIVDSNSFVLYEDSSIPFSVDDFSSSLHVEEFTDLKPPLELAENPDFQFLQE